MEKLKMTKIKLRTTSPATNNKYYISKDKGGLNECILIKGSSCIPNCVGYVWGAWYEMTGVRPKLARTNAETFYIQKDGYKRGKTPKLGAVACYQGGTIVDFDGCDGAGHVGIVVGIDGDNITIAQSNYGGTRFELKTYLKGQIPGLTLQGYIYLPDEYSCDDGAENGSGVGSNEITSEEAIEKMAKDVIAGKYGNGRYNRMNRLYNTIQNKVNQIMLSK